MSKKQLSIYSRTSNKIIWYYRYLVRSREKTIYHCCIQKSGSQWFKNVLKDDLIWKNNRYLLYTPADNFITENKKVLKNINKIPKNLIVGPLYVRYQQFEDMDKPDNYKAFFIARDPRDLIVSNYFSLKYSHSPYDPYIINMRNKLNDITQDEGISEIINTFTKGIKQTLEGWFLHTSDNILLIKFEDIFGKNQKTVFSNLIEFSGIKLSQNEIALLLEKYSFKNISGRKLGTEDVKHHYRKGIPGDWKNYFTDKHKIKFKNLAGDMLITCGYEKDNNW